ncbi:MAG: single-stranded-DNA-specific exonuclease RecJ [Clostridia bacterium]|nr:single-stranded-DNA-specific exonuclease RecJ [Clostridia bacterium]
MKIIQSSVLTDADKLNISRLANECGLLFDTARLLYSRKIDTKEKIKAFINPSKKGFLDPFLLSGMQDAVHEIENAKRLNKGVLIFGDYDADGICATTVLKLALKDYGINALYTVPEREDGYGLNVEKIKDLQKTSPIDLIITVDCGISDKDKIEELEKLGISVIVTDHHEPPQVLPNCTVIDPKLSYDEYPFKGLCGAGVAYKLARALIGEKADEYLDFVALATVADSMDLSGENRDIVCEGLKIFNNNLRPCFKYLLNDSSNKTISAQSIAFTIAPRINAGGRMGDAKCALKLFSSTDENEIYDLGVKLNEYNIARQVECERIYDEARQKIIDLNLAGDSVITVASDDWKAGFVGIVASKLVEEFCRPVIVFALQDGYYKGSARSYNGVNIFEAISSVSDLLTAFGGHAQAAGVSVSKENFLQLQSRLNEYVNRVYGKPDFTKKIMVEWKIDGKFSPRFAKEIELFEPFGVGNKRPLFSVDAKSLTVKQLKFGSPHVSFMAGGIEMLYFNGAGDTERLSLNIDKEIVFESNVSVFRGKEYFKGYVKQVVADYGDFSTIENKLFENALLAIKDEDLPAYGVKSVAELPENGRSFGTVYALADYKNLEHYPTLKDLPVCMHKPLYKNFRNCVIVAPYTRPDGYDTIVYLDKPLHYAKGFKNSYQVEGLIGYKKIDGVSTDRTDFVQVYVELEKLLGKSFNDLNSLYEHSTKAISREQFVFSTAVFMELGIFYSKDGVLKRDANAKSTLTNSAIYSKILSIKG